MFDKTVSERPALSAWEQKAPLAKREFIIRKIFINMLFLINLAGLSVALYFVISYCPIPAKAYVISPFVVGVIGAIAFLKLPTFGISRHNYHNITNPAVQLGKALALAFFTPCVLSNYFLDQTPYHDPHSANCILDELSNWTFSQISEKHGRHFNNLYRYGFIKEEDISKKDLEALRQELLPIEQEMHYLEKKYESVLKQHHKTDADQPEWFKRYRTLKGQKKGVEAKWEDKKVRFIGHLPHPTVPKDDFSNWRGRFKVTMREFFLNTHEFFPKPKSSSMGDLIA